MKTIIIDECYIGTQFPCALEYGDLSGLEEEEEQDLNNWFDDLTDQAKAHTLQENPVLHFEYGEQSEFETCAITGMKGNCVACATLILVQISHKEIP